MYPTRNEANRLLEEAEKIMNEYNPDRSVVSWAMRFVANLDACVVFTGASNLEQLQNNIDEIKNADPLNDEELKILEEVSEIINSNITVDCTKCRYCGSTNYGSGCIHSPMRKHEHRDDEKHCEFCGSSSYGSGCYYSPTRKHRHGPGANKCIWCGSTSNGSGCYYSPTGKHEK